ncbi:MAG: class I poly(R)-hydroxyalkanoic acid synthase [Pseudomonadota bacterium]
MGAKSSASTAGSGQGTPPGTPSAGPDPSELLTNLAHVYEHGLNYWATALEKGHTAAATPRMGTEIAGMGAVMAALSQQWASDPARLATAQASLAHAYVDVWTSQMRKLMGDPDAAPVASPARGDKRFADPDWEDNPYFDSLKQFYLVSSRWLEQLVDDTDGLDPALRKRAEFFTKQVTSALAPTNFAISNPQVVRETLATNAENLVDGMGQLLADVERSRDTLKISQTDTSAFAVGQNLAVTPGKVIFQNDIFQLIQYSPSTPWVRARPLLIVPPWINKFYILDLVPQKSFVKWVVDQGYTVFLMSWVNPDERHRDLSWDAYMRDGILQAADVALSITGQKQCNALGYCVGGTLLGTTLAWLAQQDTSPFSSATFLTTQLDFADAGELQVFVDEDQLATVAALMGPDGYLDGARMASAFNMLRPGDLIWPYIVNNYMLGKKPFPFDLLYWNQDSTRMAATNHLFYLTNYYKENALTRGILDFAGARLDLSAVTMPIYELATKEDHIAPAKSVYTGAQFLGGDVTFVLAGSGHIAGVVNPPEKMKYQYWTGAAPLQAPDLETWAKAATEHTGSWWPHWIEWLQKQSGALADAREPGADKNYPALESAPGSYVMTQA